MPLEPSQAVYFDPNQVVGIQARTGRTRNASEKRPNNNNGNNTLIDNLIPLPHFSMRSLILSVLEYFYPIFRKWMPIQTFRYVACGGFNTLLDIFIYFISYNFILNRQILYTPLVAISPHIAAFLMAFCISFPTGFFLNRTIVFAGSTLRGRVQLFRYLLLVLACIILNYVFIKLFVEQLHIYPTISKILTTIIVVSFSYLTQKHFTFRIATVESKKVP